MAPPLSINELIPPDDFPADQFEALYQKLGGTYGKRDEYREYIIGALYAIPYRFKALAEYDESFRSLIRDTEQAPANPSAICKSATCLDSLATRIRYLTHFVSLFSPSVRY
jgi:hypothetical protein